MKVLPEDAPHFVMTIDSNLHFCQSIDCPSHKAASLSITIPNNKKTPPSDGGAQRGIEEEIARKTTAYIA